MVSFALLLNCKGSPVKVLTLDVVQLDLLLQRVVDLKQFFVLFLELSQLLDIVTLLQAKLS